MRHDWELVQQGLEGMMNYGKRRCKNCGAVQTKRADHLWMRVVGYHWEPRAGRCKSGSPMNPQLTTAAALAAELDRAPDRIGAIARRLGFARIGRDWLFTRAEADAIRKFVATAKPGRKAGYNDLPKK